MAEENIEVTESLFYRQETEAQNGGVLTAIIADLRLGPGLLAPRTELLLQLSLRAYLRTDLASGEALGQVDKGKCGSSLKNTRRGVSALPLSYKKGQGLGTQGPRAGDAGISSPTKELVNQKCA